MPTKIWAVGEEVLAADFNDYVQQQVVATFPNAAARTAAIASPTAGMVSYLADIGALQLYNGTAWVTVPGGTARAYAQITAPTGDVANTALAIPGLAVTITAVAGHRYRLASQLHLNQRTGGPSIIRAGIREGGTQLAVGFATLPATYFQTVTFGAEIAPAAGAHTYQVYLLTDIGTAGVDAQPTGPAWLSVEDVGT